MSEYLQSTEKSAREDFYQTMLLKYKREFLKKNKLIKKEEARETERTLNLENKKGFFATKERMNNAYTTWVNKPNKPRTNLACQVKDSNYVLDGGSRVISSSVMNMGDKMRKLKKLPGQLQKEISKSENPFLEMVGEDQQDELEKIGDDQRARSNLYGYSDRVDANQERQVQLDLDKTKKEVRKKIEKGVEKYKEAKKGAEAAKAAKTGAEVAKTAKTGAEAVKATKVAKTAKNLKSVLTIAKVATLGAALETIFISLIVTVIIWWVQIIGAHLIKSKYIPRMSWLDWFGFAGNPSNYTDSYFVFRYLGA
jgi:hypothetical protein